MHSTITIMVQSFFKVEISMNDYKSLNVLIAAEMDAIDKTVVAIDESISKSNSNSNSNDHEMYENSKNVNISHLHTRQSQSQSQRQSQREEKYNSLDDDININNTVLTNSSYSSQKSMYGYEHKYNDDNINTNNIIDLATREDLENKTITKSKNTILIEKQKKKQKKKIQNSNSNYLCNKGEIIEIKTYYDRQEKYNLSLHKKLEYWSQCYFGGCDSLLVGYRNDNFQIKKIDRLKVKEIENENLYELKDAINKSKIVVFEVLQWIRSLFEIENVLKDDTMYVLGFNSMKNEFSLKKMMLNGKTESKTLNQLIKHSKYRSCHGFMLVDEKSQQAKFCLGNVKGKQVDVF